MKLLKNVMKEKRNELIMNKEKEFEEKILNKLLVDLKDIDKYKSFKNGSFIYDLGYYQGNLLINEIDRLNNIINELEKILTEEYDYCDKHIDPAFGTGMGVAKRTLDKLKDLKDSD